MSEPLRNRIILAALDALADDDPALIIGVSDNEVRIGWSDAAVEADG